MGKSIERSVQRMDRCSFFEHFLFLVASVSSCCCVLNISVLHFVLASFGIEWHGYWTSFVVYTAKQKYNNKTEMQ